MKLRGACRAPWPGDPVRVRRRVPRDAAERRRMNEQRRTDPALALFANALREVLGLDDLFPSRCAR